jgi:hypothetical protein
MPVIKAKMYNQAGTTSCYNNQNMEAQNWQIQVPVIIRVRNKMKLVWTKKREPYWDWPDKKNISS